ncbi:MAG: D-alanyl-D-alanine carboxypeptidase family protein [bacterium]
MSFFLLFAFLHPLPDISAKSAILMDYSTGRVLWAKNEKEELPPASLTKMLTAILVLEKGNLDDVVEVGGDISRVEPTCLGLKKGEKITVRDLLTALLVRSANDAALALAEYLAGSEGKFVAMMNEKAKEIGALNSNFVNCHGLHHPLHYSTAYDLALIARYALSNPIFASLVSLKRAEIKVWNNEKERKVVLESTNKLLSLYPYANGIKTGYTREAGRCLAASARKDGWQLIAVVLNSNDVWKDAQLLFEYGFNLFRHSFVARKGIPIGYLKTSGKPERIALLPKDDLVVFSPLGELPRIEVEKKIFKEEPPIRAGERLGVMRVKVNGAPWGEVDILAGSDATIGFPRKLSIFSLKAFLFTFFILFILKFWGERIGRNSFK